MPSTALYTNPHFPYLLKNKLTKGKKNVTNSNKIRKCKKKKIMNLPKKSSKATEIEQQYLLKNSTNKYMGIFSPKEATEITI